MVINQIKLLVLYLLLLNSGLAAEIAMTAEIDPSRLSENRQLEGRITILSGPLNRIDSSGFTIEGKPLKVQKILEEKAPKEILQQFPEVESDAVISVFRFYIPGKGKGLYLLPAITATIDGKSYKSIPSTYEVSETQATNSLTLETAFDGTSPLYPGQHAKFIYKISYNRDIELTDEELPFIEAVGFKKVGPKRFKDYEVDGYTVQEIIQEVRADKPGHYTFGPSLIEGFIYTTDLLNRRVYQKPRLKAEANPITVTVNPFPDKDRPPAFTGAVGQYQAESALEGVNEVLIGDKLTLRLDVTGTGEIASIELPDIACQPGFSGFFQLDEVPPSVEVDQNIKSFEFSLRPLSSEITSIPPIQFSFFDPETQSYKTVKTEPIAIQVKPISSIMSASQVGKGKEEEEQEEVLAESNLNLSGIDWRIQLGKDEKAEIDTIYPLSAGDLYLPTIKVRFLWILIGALSLLLLLQFFASKLLLPKIKKSPKVNSETLLDEAFKYSNDPSQLYHWMEKAFILLLKEKNFIPEKVQSHEELTTAQEAPRNVKVFLATVETKRYGGRDDFPAKSIIKEAKQLYRTIRYGK